MKSIFAPHPTMSDEALRARASYLEIAIMLLENDLRAMKDELKSTRNFIAINLFHHDNVAPRKIHKITN